jgi:hypothetical protein
MNEYEWKSMKWHRGHKEGGHWPKGAKNKGKNKEYLVNEPSNWDEVEEVGIASIRRLILPIK